MMRIPFSYIWRSLWARRLTTLLTVTGVALVVFVFAGVLMLARGLQATLIDTGAPDDVIVLRRAANSELVSQIDRGTASLFADQPEVAKGADGRPLVSREVVVIIDLHRRTNDAISNVTVRGVSPKAMELRKGVKLTSGRIFQPGTHEIVVGSNISERFKNVEVGKELSFGGDKWTVVGTFNAGGTGFDSELWGDVDQLMQAFGRSVYSTVTFRLADPSQFPTIQARLKADPRTQYVDLKREQQFYREQSQAMANFIRVLGMIVTIIFSIGAMIGAMITMYAAVSNRVAEVGTLRALGFHRRSVLAAFLTESMLLSVIGGAAGVALASLLSFARVSTLNFTNFSEIGFGFQLAPGVVLNAMIFAVVMGIVGGFLPAVAAARLDIVRALRAS
jgi:putative ABC transport system permease protein